MAEHKEPLSEAKPLDEKTEAELKREAKARLRRLDPPVVVQLFHEVLGRPVAQSLGGFVEFIRAHAVISLAVGFVLATQVQAVVKQLIASFIDPLFELFGGKSLSTSQFTIHGAAFGWGAFVYSLLNFLVVVATIYALIKILKLEELDKKDK